ncbi:hypothetical protein F4819DRAFT_141198 [Hypoxylon fuscum]|nr:hypothetical protein F4819DRAFT_141198 [Hypoxylon fuscum]
MPSIPSRIRLRGGLWGPTLDISDDAARGGRNPTKQFKLFTLFPNLPPELQILIWEFTLPSMRMARMQTTKHGTTLWPNVELPKPPTPELLSAWIPLPQGYFHEYDFDDYELPVALRVCRASREIALKHFIPFLAENAAMGLNTLSYIWKNDIIDARAPEPVLRQLLERRKNYTPGLVDTLGRLGAEASQMTADRGRFLYDLRSHRLCMLINGSVPLMTHDGHYIQHCHQKDHVVIPFYSIEEWLFGSRIVIGHVPERLRHCYDEGSEALEKYITQLSNESMYPVVHPGGALEPSPITLLFFYIRVLHKMANRTFSTLCARTAPKTILETFVAIMDRRACPGCHARILPLLEGRYPELPLDLMDLSILIPRDDFTLQPRIHGYTFEDGIIARGCSTTGLCESEQRVFHFSNILPGISN